MQHFPSFLTNQRSLLSSQHLLVLRLERRVQQSIGFSRGKKKEAKKPSLSVGGC